MIFSELSPEFQYSCAERSRRKETNSKKNQIKINVAGRLFEADVEIFNKFPNTLLGNPLKRMRYYDHVHQEYFLDRHRDTFQVILDFYNSGGVLERPDDIPIDIFINELKFYHLDREILEEFLREEGILHVEVEKELPRNEIQKYIWQLFEGNEGSFLSKIITVISAIVISVSVVVFCLETLHGFESFSTNSDLHLLMGLNRCQEIDENYKNMSESFPKLFNPNDKDPILNYINNRPGFHNTTSMLDLYNESYLEQLLNRTLLHCQSSVSKLSFKFAFRMCHIELFDESEILKDVFISVNLNEIKKFTNNYHEYIATAHQRLSRHKRSVDNKEKQPRDSLEQKSGWFSDPKNRLRLALSSFTLQSCLQLNDQSRITPYEWLIIEGLMGSKGGILFLIETSCILWFVAEFFLRFFSAPNKKKFAKVSIKLRETIHYSKSKIVN